MPQTLAAAVHAPILESRSVLLPDEAATSAFAQRLAACPALRRALIRLGGGLGAGKTTLVRHLLHALGVQGRVKSPTYTLVEPYTPPGLPVWHFDLYRFNDPHEWDDAGLRELIAAEGLKLVEWPERAGTLLPDADLSLTLLPLAEPQRRVEVHAHTARGLALLHALGDPPGLGAA